MDYDSCGLLVSEHLEHARKNWTATSCSGLALLKPLLDCKGTSLGVILDRFLLLLQRNPELSLSYRGDTGVCIINFQLFVDG